MCPRSRNVIYCFVLFFVLVYDVDAYLPEGASCTADGYPGICLIWKKCYNLVLDIPKREYPPLCSYQGFDPVICCTSCSRTEDITNVVLSPKGGVLKKTDQISWNKCIDYSLALSYENENDSNVYSFVKIWMHGPQCFSFITSKSKAVGGRDAKRSEFPHMALLGYGNSENTSQWLCGGTLINDRFILTAGHCISTPVLGQVRYAALGMLKRTDPQEFWHIYKIQRIIAHPDYRPPSKYNDIALLQADRSISFNKNVLPACLPNLAEPIDDERAVATGWGVTGPRTPLADNLQAVEVNKFDQLLCNVLFKRHRHLRRGFSNDTQMCFGDQNQVKDTCEGDSGGPLQIFGQAYMTQKTIIGVTSYGPQCKTPGQAGVYTQVRPYVPWIDSIIWSN